MRNAEDAIRGIVERYATLIRKVILSHVFAGDLVDPQDVEQEILIRIWTALRRGKNIGNLASYIKKVAYTATIDELRRLRKQAPYRDRLMKDRLVRLLDPQALDMRDPLAECEDRQKQEDLDRLVDGLPPDRRQVLRLYCAGMSVEEIGAICGWDRSRVRHLLYRGIDQAKRIAAGPAGASPGRPARALSKDALEGVQSHEST